MTNETLSVYASNQVKIEALAAMVPEDGFSFQGDGHKLSILALTLMDEIKGIQIDKAKQIDHVHTRLLVLAKYFDWNLTANQEHMIRAFSSLAVQFPQILGR